MALATYNGANFIRQQIESIQKQTYRNWRLIISDDNSSDDTVDIIKDMMSNDSRIYLVGNKRQGGVIQNFNYALSQTTSEIVLLCDQDDIWPEERLEILIDKFKALQRNDFVPAMMFTDLKLVDENNCLIAESFYRTNNINPQDNLKNNNLLWRSTVYG
ncbi:glycosyltransferase, partial [Escherichia coli]|uniref:glycosyltransferase n=1 Tax=Escherichia coli TaxID=562 RepID=UPI00286FA23B